MELTLTCIGNQKKLKSPVSAKFTFSGKLVRIYLDHVQTLATERNNSIHSILQMLKTVKKRRKSSQLKPLHQQQPLQQPSLSN